MQNQYRQFLIEKYPQLKTLLLRCSDFQPIRIKQDPVFVAVVRTVTGQMLSRQSAQAIFARLSLILEQDPGLENTQHPDLLRVGLSNNKAKTILNFAQLYRQDPQRYENWSELDYPELRQEVCQIWGISDWTASILAISYFGHEDVFPDRDGMIKKALKLLQQHDIRIDPELSSPYQTYLAVFLWKVIDEKLI